MRIGCTQLSIAIASSVWLSFALGTTAMPASSASPAAQVETSPHAAALELLFRRQGETIRHLDTENWWHDVKERSWSVRRPFYPGGIDSTHLFVVTYRIEGTEVGTWSVDTARGEVTLLPRKRN